jgi:hypothetical protein
MARSISLILFYTAMFASCQHKEEGKDTPILPTEQKQYSIRGDSIVRLTFDTLRSALQKSLAEKGAAGVIEYCSINAYSITSLHAKEGIMVRRTAEKYRNTANAPDSLEKLIFARYVTAFRNKQPLQVQLLKSGNDIHYFKPIILQSMCRNCHGVAGTDIQAAALQAINKRYPSDMATGFKEGDLRGMWHIRFPHR